MLGKVAIDFSNLGNTLADAMTLSEAFLLELPLDINQLSLIAGTFLVGVAVGTGTLLWLQRNKERD